MYNPIVPLLAVAAAVGTVFAADTPTTRSYWTKVNGTWTYMPEKMWKTLQNTQPTGMPQIILPLSHVPPVNLTVLPRWVKGAREAVGSRYGLGDAKKEKEEEKRDIKAGYDEECYPYGPPEPPCNMRPL